nr:LodA/GoxA family CTQ-dependent oxidase [Paraflavitalea speifideiaquila]
MKRNDIKKVAIYPAIGIARIGNSPEYFLASDIPDQAPSPDGGYKAGNNLFKSKYPGFVYMLWTMKAIHLVKSIRASKGWR